MPEPAHGPAGPTGAGSVVLDLGGDIGALVLETPASLSGKEIEISQIAAATPGSATPGSATPGSATPGSATPGGAAVRTHSLVRERRTAAGTSYAAVYPGLAAGQYLIWRHADTPAGEVTIDGGMVTRFRWPD